MNMQPSSEFVIIRELVKSFDEKPSDKSHRALDTISTTISSGKLIGLAGPDGAGKTTLIRILAGLLPATSGSVTIAGYDVMKEQTAVHTLISYMPQRFGLYEDLTVMQNLSLYADLQGILETEKTARFHTLLSFTGLAPFQRRLAKDLSGGMKQKLGLACSLLRKPQLLLLDEPTVGVDPLSRRELWNMIFSLVRDAVTVICSTCYLEEAEKCDEVLLLDKGKLLFDGPPGAFTQKCAHKTYLLRNGIHDRRKALTNLLQDPHIVDGTIQGNALRVVTKTPQPPDLSAYGYTSASVLPTPPRLEDAFIDLLGGGPKGASPLSKMPSLTRNGDDPIVIADNLTKRFGSFTAVNNVSFSVKRGEIFGLLGPNGAGKSTTFKMLCGLLKPSEGKASVAGYSLQKSLSDARMRIGYMAQKFSLYDNMSVLQNLRFFHGIYNNPNTQILEEMISMFSLEPYLDEPALQLPFGFKQRLALACALMHSPEVLFLDEPTSGVDPLTRREFWNHINGMVSHGVAVIVTTHFMDEAEYCDRLGLISQGKLIQIGTPEDLKASVQSVELPNPTIEDAFVLLSTDAKSDRVSGTVPGTQSGTAT